MEDGLRIDERAVQDVVRRARLLAKLERSSWRAFLLAAYGGLDLAHVKELVDQANADVRVLDEARRRIRESSSDAADLRARQLLRRAAIRALRTQPA